MKFTFFDSTSMSLYSALNHGAYKSFPLFLCLYSLLCFFLSCIQCIQCYGLKSLQNKITKQSQICFGFLVVVVVMVVSSLSSSSCDLWRVVSPKDSHMEKKKSIEQHLHANERGRCCCCYACMQRFDINFAWSNLSKPHTIVGHKGWGAGGEMGCFARMGWWHLWMNLSVRLSIKLVNPRSPVPPGLLL